MAPTAGRDLALRGKEVAAIRQIHGSLQLMSERNDPSGVNVRSLRGTGGGAVSRKRDIFLQYQSEA